MTYRIALLADIHGNVAALDAALADVRREAPDLIALLGDYVMNGPRPCDVVDRVRELEAQGAVVIQGNTDVAAADLDLAAAFPWIDEVPRVDVVAAEWAYGELGDERLDWLRRLPSERRIHVDDTLVLACHASPAPTHGSWPWDTRTWPTCATWAGSRW